MDGRGGGLLANKYFYSLSLLLSFLVSSPPCFSSFSANATTFILFYFIIILVCGDRKIAVGGWVGMLGKKMGIWGFGFRD